jgi:hypothetical protein
MNILSVGEEGGAVWDGRWMGERMVVFLERGRQALYYKRNS